MARNETDLRRLLHSTEHSFVERKTFGDTRDWVKTVVAFANTLRDDQEGVLFIGATDDGAIQDVPTNLDKLQMTFSDKIQSIYPPVYYTTETVQEDGKECLAIIVPGSSSKPHFAGPPYVRDGSRSIVATSERYESLLAARTGKAYELQRWQGKTVSIRTFTRQAGVAYVVSEHIEMATVLQANQFYATVSFGNRTVSYPLSAVEISYDNAANRLEFQIKNLPTTY